MKVSIDAVVTLCVLAVSMALIAGGLATAFSWSVACYVLGFVLLGLVVLSRIVVRRPAK